MNTNLTILRESVGLTKENQIVYMARLSAVKDSKSEVLSENLVALAEKSGLVWSVSAEQIWKHFKYHANVRGFGVRSGFAEVPVEYAGDIPDFALKRAELAVRLGMKCITLHSVVPLAVDPVMVGWFGYPLTNGFVLAVWYNEKELEL